MTNIKENTSWQGGSIDRQWMIDKIYEVCWWDFCDVMCDWEKKRGKYPVMIWDVLEYVMLNYPSKIFNQIPYLFTKYRKPIEDQSIECIKYVYDLVSEK
jgi:hypothetical protein